MHDLIILIVPHEPHWDAQSYHTNWTTTGRTGYAVLSYGSCVTSRSEYMVLFIILIMLTEAVWVHSVRILIVRNELYWMQAVIILIVPRQAALWA